jgi:hypothetical protein
MENKIKEVKVSELVALLEDESPQASRELADLKSTIIVNFSEIKRSNCPTLFKRNDHKRMTATAMLIVIVEYYESKIKELQNR